MAPIQLNRRRFLGCSAAAGLAISQGQGVPVEAAGPPRSVRLGLIGLGNRGTGLLRAVLELPGAEVVAVCDAEPRHRTRAQGITGKATGTRPDAYIHPGDLLDRPDIEAVVVALPCDLHARSYLETLAAGKHLYAEKPLALTPQDCDALLAAAASRPDLAFHVGLQRRSNPRYQKGIELIRRGEIGTLLEARFAWSSSNGPVNGHEHWLARRERSGDWMVEQAVHVWDLLHWIAGGPPCRAYGHGRRDLYADVQPARDVTDHYSVLLDWPSGFSASFVHSWIDPADDAFTGTRQHVVGTAGGIDLGTGVVTYRDRTRARRTVHPEAIADTRAALQSFLDTIRNGNATPPPVSLADARDATRTGLLVRKAVDERRVVTLDEIERPVGATESARRGTGA